MDAIRGSTPKVRAARWGVVFVWASLWCATALLGGARVARADDKPTRLDSAALTSMLDNLGYEVTHGTYASGSAWHSIKLPHMGATYFVTVSGGGQDLIWVVMDLWTLEPDQAIPPEILRKLLEANFGPSRVYFSYGQADRLLRLKGAVWNQDVRPALLRGLVQEAVETCQRTSALWNPAQWPTSPSAPSAPASGATGPTNAPPTPSLVGSWDEVRPDRRKLSIAIEPDLSFRQTEAGAQDLSGTLELEGSSLTRIAADGSRERFTVEVTARTATFYDDQGVRKDFYWRRR